MVRLHVAQYLAPDPETVAQVQALAELLGLEFRISGPIVAVMVPGGDTVEVLQRAVPRPSAVIQVNAEQKKTPSGSDTVRG